MRNLERECARKMFQAPVCWFCAGSCNIIFIVPTVPNCRTYKRVNEAEAIFTKLNSILYVLYFTMTESCSSNGCSTSVLTKVVKQQRPGNIHFQNILSHN